MAAPNPQTPQTVPMDAGNNTPPTAAQLGAASMVAQRMRLAAQHQATDLSGLTREGVGIAVRNMEVASHASLNELAPGMRSAVRTTKVLVHFMEGAQDEYILGQNATVQEAQVMCNKFATAVKQQLFDLLETQEGIVDPAAKELRFRHVCPAGLQAFSVPLDDKRPAGSVAVAVAETCVEWFQMTLEAGANNNRGRRSERLGGARWGRRRTCSAT